MMLSAIALHAASICIILFRYDTADIPMVNLPCPGTLRRKNLYAPKVKKRKKNIEKLCRMR